MKITYSKEAQKFLKKQDQVSQKRIFNAIEALPFGDVKKLQGLPGYRLRVGNYRVIFDNTGVVIHIIKIGNRGQIYEKK